MGPQQGADEAQPGGVPATHPTVIPYEIEGDIEQLERTVLAALRLYITDGEWEDIKALMPKQLAAALP